MIVVKAKTIEQWRSILDYYFAEGYDWEHFSHIYYERHFKRGRQLVFEEDKKIHWATRGTFRETITYEEIMKQSENTHD